jgi:GlpG protein
LSDRSETGTAILAFSDSKPAQLLADYLTTSNIEVQIVERKASVAEADHSSNSDTHDSEHGSPVYSADTASTGVEHDKNDKRHYQILVLRQQDVPKALRIAQDFVANPNQTKYQQAAWQVGSTVDNAPKKVKHRSNGLPNWSKDFIAAPFMSGVLLICIIVFVLSYLGAFPAIYSALNIRSLDELAQTHEWWRLFTPAFIHFTAMHIVFNLIWWWILGSQLERIFGTASLALIFAIAAISSNVAQLLVSGPNFGGLSGVVYSLFGFVWWIGFLRPRWGIGLPNNLVIFLLGWIVVGYLGILGLNMANEAHLIGLVSGCLMALVTHQFAGLKAAKKR